jgi:hypothetical protein
LGSSCTIGTPGTNSIASPTKSKTIGYESPMRRAAATSGTAINSPKSNGVIGYGI